jgi:hypothetical protein
MKIVKPYILSLMLGALVAGSQACAAPDDAKYDKSQQEARAASDKWRDEIKAAFQVPGKREVHLKAMQDSSEKLRLFLVGKPCRDGAQAKQIEDYIHGRFHTLYGSVVADIKHGVDLNCRNNALAVTFWITDFTPTPESITAEKNAADKENLKVATKRIFGNWATAVVPALTDKSKKIEDIRAWATRMSEQAKAQIQTVACPDTSFSVIMDDAGTQMLFEHFSDFKFDVKCGGKNMTLVYDFTNLKRK